MVMNERPGVYSGFEISSSLYGRGNGKTVGLAACAASGETGRCVRLNSYVQAVALFGDCSLTKLVALLLKNGASAIETVAVEEAGTLKAYEDAFELLMQKEDVAFMLCDSGDTAVWRAMRAAIADGGENAKYRMGFVEGQGTVAEVCAQAEALNFERMVLVYPGLSEAGIGAAAAALCGQLSAEIDPARPVNGTELRGLEGFSRIFSDWEIGELVKSGVTPVESLYGSPCVVRGLTTRTKTGEIFDTRLRELTTMLVIDNVIPGVRNALRMKFPRAKNTAQTRGAIRTQVMIELEDKRKKEIIDGYGEVTAQADETDPTVCRVSFEFAVVHGLNHILLSASISV